MLERYISSLEEQSDFELARIKANKFLEVLSIEFQGIKFWKHRGFEESHYDILAHDGVHFSALGQSRFYKSLRGAILTALKHLNYQPLVVTKQRALVSLQPTHATCACGYSQHMRLVHVVTANTCGLCMC